MVVLMSEAKPLELTLTVMSSFKAFHHLMGYEVPHHHRFDVQVAIVSQYPIQGDWVVDLVQFQKKLDDALAVFVNQNLNEVMHVAPTCEHIAAMIWSHFSDSAEAEISEVMVTNCNLEGVALGSAKLRRRV